MELTRCEYCRQAIADGRICTDCKHAVMREFIAVMVPPPAPYTPPPHLPGDEFQDAYARLRHLFPADVADHVIADMERERLTEPDDEQRERFAQYGKPGDRD